MVKEVKEVKVVKEVKDERESEGGVRCDDQKDEKSRGEKDGNETRTPFEQLVLGCDPPVQVEEEEKEGVRGGAGPAVAHCGDHRHAHIP